MAALEAAAQTAETGREGLRKAAMAMDVVQAETRLHDDLADRVNHAWVNAADAAFELRARLAAEQNGER
ncbi:hypothetical protein [Promicromonospora sp. AC04]|uniref:hypothetical protein n=1 Tax=Promicromonospora sp. AC04 TaxID=2135723 RepID=UPI0011B1F195|nr:hypothetical protein [Promicromonospora sp. AC04]